jgi:dihydrodipicolinate synthase/N-acetylneuraminate lyase
MSNHLKLKIPTVPTQSALLAAPDAAALLRPRRRITGMSAILLPYKEIGTVDWDAFQAHVARTAEAGLVPAVNMDTGYVNLLDDDTIGEVLRRTRDALGGDGEFVAGAFVGDAPGAKWDAAAFLRQTERIQALGGTPVIFQSYGLTSRSPGEVVEAYEEIARECPRFIGFELGRMFVPFGRIYDLETYARIMDIPQCIGAKHSSLDRSLEWERLRLRDERRPDFMVLTGNDLAIDMVMYGSDYLLGLSTFAPDHFARRDALWAAGDPAFYELNDLLQYLGFFSFRAPVPAYKHSAAQFLKLRGWIKSDRTHPRSPWRTQCDLGVLRDIAQRLESL